MRVLAAALLLVPVTAAAQTAETREGALREEAVPRDTIEPAHLHLSWRADATLAETNQLGADGHSVLAMTSASAEVAVSHEACDIAIAGGQVSATADGTPDTAPLAGEQWASLCPIAGMVTIVLGHHLEWDVRPTLLAPPRLRPTLNRREVVSFGLSGPSHQLNDPGPLALWHPPPERLRLIDTTFRFEHDWAAGDGGLGVDSIGADMTFFVYEREREDGGAPLSVAIIRTDTDATMAGGGSPNDITMALDAVAIEGARVGRARIGGRFGMVAGDVSTFDLMDTRTASVIALDAAASLEVDAGGATWRVAADRGHWGLWDGRLVLDDRLSAGVSGVAGRVRLRGEAFVARDHLLGLDGLTEAGTGGATAIAEGDVGRFTTVRVRADGGRGFYASGAGLDDPRWGGEVLATLTMHAGTR